MFEGVAAHTTTGLERVDKKTEAVYLYFIARVRVCLICVIPRRYFGDINGNCLSSSIPSPFFMQLFYGNNNSQESVIRSSNRPANENSYCEDDSFIRDKLNSSR